MKITLILLRKKKPYKKGNPVVINIVDRGRQKRIATNLFSQPEHWDFVTQLPNALHPEYHEVFSEVVNLKLKIRELTSDKETDFKKIEIVLKGRRAENNEIIAIDFFSFTDTLIEEKKRLNKHSNAIVYNTAKIQFSNYTGALEFKDLNYNILLGFVQQKQKDGLKNTSIHNYLRTLRAIYNQAVLRGITEDKKPFTGVFNGLKVRSHQMRKKYLTLESIAKIENASFTGAMDGVRDLFLLQFYLGGQDLIDVYNLKRGDIENNRIFIKRAKIANGYQFDLLLSNKIRQILKKYKGSNFIFPHRKDFKGYVTYRRRYGRYLIDMQKRLDIKVQPLEGNLSIKIARHTFANIGKRLGVEEDMLRELMGHERDDIDNFYKDRFPEEERDLVQLKIINDTK